MGKYEHNHSVFSYDLVDWSEKKNRFILTNRNGTIKAVDGLKEIYLTYKGELIGVMGKGYIQLNFDKFTTVSNEKE